MNIELIEIGINLLFKRAANADYENVWNIIKKLNVIGVNMPDMPNIRIKTMGGKVWWRNLADYNGWRVQQNSVSKHCRIIDPDNYRIAWGGEEVMNTLFEKLCKL